MLFATNIDKSSVVYFKQQSGYTTFRMNKKVEPHQWGDLWVREGFQNVPECLYFYESPPGGENGVWGYFSFSPIPGTPHQPWTPETDNVGEPWGWTFVSEDWTVEISKFISLALWFLINKFKEFSPPGLT